MARSRPVLTWDFELGLRPTTLTSTCRIAGVDEAGRGCLAGPVYAAAVILPERFQHDLLHDSKRLTIEAREELALHLCTHPEVFWAVGSATSKEIDRLNILQASLLAMVRAIEVLSPRPAHCLIDGNAKPKHPTLSLQPIIDGDALCPSIAAASILAKTARDAHMREVAALYPAYGFAYHKGYATPEHQRALTLHGPCPIHRHSFRPVRLASGAETNHRGGDRELW